MSDERHVWATPLRITIGIHLAAVSVCVLFARLDRSSIGLPTEAPIIGLAVNLLLFASMLALLLCPLAVLVVSPEHGASLPLLYALIAEAVLCLVQLMALLPMCS